MDTGLMAWLTRWLTPDTIRNGAKAGQFFETWVVSEIIKSQLNAGRIPSRNIYYYRDANQREIDLIIEEGHTVYPVEIKMSAKPVKKMAREFHLLEPITKAGNLELGDGCIMNQYPDILLLDKNLRAVPVGYL